MKEFSAELLKSVLVRKGEDLDLSLCKGKAGGYYPFY